MDLEKLADQIIQLSPEQAQQLQVILKAKVMPEVEKQKGLLDEQMQNPQVDQMARPVEPTMLHQQLEMLLYAAYWVNR